MILESMVVIMLVVMVDGGGSDDVCDGHGDIPYGGGNNDGEGGSLSGGSNCEIKVVKVIEVVFNGVLVEIGIVVVLMIVIVLVL